MFNTNISIVGEILIKRTTYNEVKAMDLVSKYTKIKIPKIYKIIKNDTDDECIIHMEYIEGEILGNCLENMTEEQKNKIKIQLKDAFTQLREIHNPYNYYICSADGNSINDHRIGPEKVGPFNTEEEFNNTIGNYNVKTKNKSIFTHADIKPHNIILDNNNDIVLIDWECAGWYPEYWEYTKSLFLINEYKEWIDIMTDIFKEYKKDLEREKNILKTYEYF